MNHVSTQPTHRHDCRCSDCNRRITRYTKGNRCHRCEGTGVVTEYTGRILGRASNGELVRSAHQVPFNRACECRTYWNRKIA